jgi:hypothetical protein
MTRTINQANRAIFELHLSREYADLFQNDPNYAYSASRNTPSELAYKMTLGLAKGEANKDGTGIRTTCKKLGINYTYKAIGDYLTLSD